MQERQIVIANQLVNYLTNDVLYPPRDAVVFLHVSFLGESKKFVESLRDFLKQ